MEQQAQRGSRLIRSAMFAVDVVRQKKCLYLLRFVIAIEEISQAARQKRNELRKFRTRNSSKTLTHPQQVTPSTQGLRINVRWRLEKKRLKISRELL